MTTTIPEVSVEELNTLRKAKKDFVLLDVREPHEYTICNIDGTLIPLGQLPNRLEELDRNQPIVVHCKLGGRSRQAAQLLLEAGFPDVRNLQGGIMAWIDRIDPSLQKY